jgi:hypothetical protein
LAPIAAAAAAGIVAGWDVQVELVQLQVAAVVGACFGPQHHSADTGVADPTEERTRLLQ